MGGNTRDGWPWSLTESHVLHRWPSALSRALGPQYPVPLSPVSEEGLGSWGHGMTLEGGGAGQERAAITSPGWDYEPDSWAWDGSDRQAGAA